MTKPPKLIFGGFIPSIGDTDYWLRQIEKARAEGERAGAIGEARSRMDAANVGRRKRAEDLDLPTVDNRVAIVCEYLREAGISERTSISDIVRRHGERINASFEYRWPDRGKIKDRQLRAIISKARAVVFSWQSPR